MIEAVYTLTEKEFVEASNAYCQPQAKKMPGYLLIQFFSIIFVCVAIISTHFAPFWISCCLWVSFIGMVIAQQWRKRAVPVYQASAYAQYNEEVTVRLDEEGFQSSKPGRSESWMSWASFTGWRETENMFILGVSLSWIPIPKSAFDQLRQNEIRALFLSHLPQQSKAA